MRKHALVEEPEGLRHHGSLSCDPARHFLLRLQGSFTDVGRADRGGALRPDRPAPGATSIEVEGHPEPVRMVQLLVSPGDRTIATMDGWLALERPDPTVIAHACPDGPQLSITGPRRVMNVLVSAPPHTPA